MLLCRYLVEGSTGLFTGSVYSDRTLAAKGFYGENESPECGCTIAVKTHGYSLMGVPVDRSVRLQDQDRFFRRALLLLRNPYSSIVSYRNFQGAGHLGIASPNAFIKDDWNAFVKSQTLIWRSYALDWLIHGRSIEVIHYEHLREDPQRELVRALEFLRVQPDPQRLQCALQYQEGLFRRQTPDTALYKTRNPFTKEHHEVMESAIHDVNNALARRGLGQLPTHLYEFKRENGPFGLSKADPSTITRFSSSTSTAPTTILAKQSRKFSKLLISKSSSNKKSNLVDGSKKHGSQHTNKIETNVTKFPKT